jgi:hypothetical protein
MVLENPPLSDDIRCFFSLKGHPGIPIYIGYPSHVNDRDHEITGSILLRSVLDKIAAELHKQDLGGSPVATIGFNTKSWSYDIL